MDCEAEIEHKTRITNEAQRSSRSSETGPLRRRLDGEKNSRMLLPILWDQDRQFPDGFRKLPLESGIKILDLIAYRVGLKEVKLFLGGAGFK